ncbi:MetQ/NlpA family ABC transporter substrate-binding protein [Lacisediminihabitans profunda]|uniref:Lipoprotein n=1 Tax=Lacisediminihabitans profunda TaxID=2594790 RepID=A0A5C8UV11_9MICO|nr:MetQ/NlpA family ABC transporter substrate-binding protein [Lacisediminihabitans profunda]TXN31439.1 MetQ/NlpA family ABC transporter substrate-binding protein [Lacisediminihabitans profunda]
MNIPTRFAAAGAVVALAVALTACSTTAPATSATVKSLGTINVGALQTPAGDILKYVSDNLAADAGLTITFTPFTDYNTPNTALGDGSIDANLFQNSTFLQTYNTATKSTLVSAGEVYLPSAAFYSDKISSLKKLGKGAKIAVPSDPTNEGRALKILAAKKLITVGANPTKLADITANPSKFDFVEIDNATLARSLPDVDAAFVTISFALPAGLTAKQAILIEGSDSPYYNVLATSKKLEKDPRVLELYKLLTSAATQKYIEKTWGGLVVPVAK